MLIRNSNNTITLEHRCIVGRNHMKLSNQVWDFEFVLKNMNLVIIVYN